MIKSLGEISKAVSLPSISKQSGRHGAIILGVEPGGTPQSNWHFEQHLPIDELMSIM